MPPENDNTDPFASPDTALAELYRLRREMLKKDASGMPLTWWRQRADALKKLDRAVKGLLAVLPPI